MHFRDPNLVLSALWENMDIRHHKYLDINVTTKMRENYRWVRVGFWTVYLDQVIFIDYVCSIHEISVCRRFYTTRFCPVLHVIEVSFLETAVKTCKLH